MSLNGNISPLGRETSRPTESSPSGKNASSVVKMHHQVVRIHQQPPLRLHIPGSFLLVMEGDGTI